MGLQTTTLTIGDDGGRDRGKKFVLREQSAMRIEKWAARFLLNMDLAGVEVPEDIAEAGLEGIARMGLKAFAGISWEGVEPLLDEMLTWAQYVPDPAQPLVERGIIESDIEELKTLIKIRAELFTMHTGFSNADDMLKSTLGRTTSPAPSNTSTSPASSPALSRRATRR